MKRLNKIDPKTINVPNVCFSLVGFEDKRSAEYTKQRLQYGFDDSETWDLSLTIAKFIAPRLKRFIEITDDALNHDEVIKAKFRDVLAAMETVIETDGDFILCTAAQTKTIKKGLKAFPEVFSLLYW